jgi:hypothetical protein
MAETEKEKQIKVTSTWMPQDVMDIAAELEIRITLEEATELLDENEDDIQVAAMATVERIIKNRLRHFDDDREDQDGGGSNSQTEVPA